jgi:hypothetical protein
VSSSSIIANGQPIEDKLPCTNEEFFVAQDSLPRVAVVEYALARAQRWS